jgi:predicted aspartyl protease
MGGSASFDNMGLLDSGSTDSAIPKNIAEILGLKLGKKTRILTPGGEIEGYESEVKIEVPIKHNPVRLVLPCHVIDGLDEIILGRLGFFEAFEITFCEADSLVRLKDVRSKKTAKRV